MYGRHLAKFGLLLGMVVVLNIAIYLFLYLYFLKIFQYDIKK